jgi:hypothetical protein
MFYGVFFAWRPCHSTANQGAFDMFSQALCITPSSQALKGWGRTIHLSVAVAAIAGFAAAPATATTLFQEDFEAYAVGSNITGQGGWVPDYVNSTLNVGNGTALATKVLNGLDPTNGGQNLSARVLASALDPNRITTFAFDAYATSAAAAHNAGIGFGNNSTQNFLLSGPHWLPELFGAGGRRWSFDAVNFTGRPTDFIDVPGGYDTEVQMSIVVDGVANEVYGVYDFGSGAHETPHYAVTDAQIATLNEVGVEFDFRGTRGPELDNLRVFDNVSTGVPEPRTLLLFAASLGLLGFTGRRR